MHNELLGNKFFYENDNNNKNENNSQFCHLLVSYMYLAVVLDAH